MYMYLYKKTLVCTWPYNHGRNYVHRIAN